MNQDTADAIQLGVLYLDDVHPGWEDKIDILELDINSYGRCVLGQVLKLHGDDAYNLFTAYREETYRLHDWLQARGVTVNGNSAVTAGFESSDFDQAGLTRAWVEVLGR